MALGSMIFGKLSGQFSTLFYRMIPPNQKPDKETDLWKNYDLNVWTFFSYLSNFFTTELQHSLVAEIRSCIY